MFTGVEPAPGLPAPDPELVPLLVGGIYSHLSRYVRLGRTQDLPRVMPALMRFSLSVTGQSGAHTLNLTPPLY